MGPAMSVPTPRLAPAAGHPASLTRPLVHPGPGAADTESGVWLRDLRATGARRDAAIARLHALLVRGARHELARRRASLPALPPGELEDLAMHAADDALVAVLGKLDQYRGASRFTTWAYKFVLLEAAVRLRRRAWRDRDVLLDGERWPSFADGRLVDDDAETAELLTELRHGIQAALTPYQREVLVALAVEGVPIDVLAERLNTTRGALYKALHDSRQKLRRHLADAGHDAYDRKDGQR
jgi:RNA polymerase sigma-70 factor, ECF subfamily